MKKGWKWMTALLVVTLMALASLTACTQKYTVKFDLCGGEGSITAQTLKENEIATRPETDPTRTGYVFDGWFAAVDGDEVYTFTKGVTADTTVYAHWRINTYVVTFKVDGVTYGTPQTVDYGKAATAPADPEKESTTQYDYTFKGWDKAFDNITEDLTVNALFEDEVRGYTVTFKVDGVTYGTPQVVDYGEGATAPADPVKESTAQYNFTFNKWDKAFNNITGDLTVNALFTSVLREYTVTFKLGDETYGEPQTVPYGARASEPADPEDNDYVFVGWYTAETGGEKYGFTQVTENITLHARIVDAHYVSFDLNGPDGNIPAQKVGEGETAISEAAPVYEGYVFAGWYTEVEGGEKYDFSTPVFGDITLHAHWGMEYSEDNLTAIGERGWTITAAHADNLWLWWSNTGETSFGVFSLSEEVTKNGYGKSIKVNMDGVLPANNADGGHFVSYYISGLTKGTEYVFSFWMLSEAFQLKTMAVMNEGFYGNTAQMTNLTITEYPSEWTKAEVRFVADPSDIGLCAIALAFQQGTENGGSGILYLDELNISEYVPEKEMFVEDNLTGIGERGWSISETHADKLWLQWSNTSETSFGVFSLSDEVTKGGYGKSVKVNMDGVLPANNADGGHFLSYYVSGLTAGTEYVYSFWMKSAGFQLKTMTVMNESFYGNTVQMTSLTIAEYPVEWTKVEVRFTAAPSDIGLCAITFAFQQGTENGGSGVLYLDELEIAEYVPVNPLYLEDELTGIGERGWGAIDESFAEKLYLQWFSTAEASFGVFSLSEEVTKEGYGKSIKVDLTGVTSTGGSHELFYYVSGLAAGTTYKYSVWVKASADFAAANIAFFESYAATTETYFTEYDDFADWKKVEVVFTAAPNAAGIDLVRIAVNMSDSANAGVLYLDELEIAEYVPVNPLYLEDELTGIGERGWSISETHADKLWLQWSNTSETSFGVFSLSDEVTKGGYGKSVKVNMDGVLPANNADGGHFLSYYVSGLTAGTEYVYSFWMKSAGFQLKTMTVMNESFYGNTVQMTSLTIAEYPVEWTKVEVRFTAAPSDIGLCAITFAFQQGTENGGSGVLYLDELEIAVAL